MSRRGPTLRTEAAAWRYLAEKFMGRVTDMTDTGLCYAITELDVQRQIPEPMVLRMRTRLKAYLGRKVWMFSPYGTRRTLYPREWIGHRPNREARALVCLWFAEETEAEGR